MGFPDITGAVEVIDGGDGVAEAVTAAEGVGVGLAVGATKTMVGGTVRGVGRIGTGIGRSTRGAAELGAGRDAATVLTWTAVLDAGTGAVRPAAARGGAG